MPRSQAVKGGFTAEEGRGSSQPGTLGEDKASAERRGQKANGVPAPACPRAVLSSPGPPGNCLPLPGADLNILDETSWVAADLKTPPLLSSRCLQFC